ncbi:Oxysterol-binding protein-domain-containing protein [Blastocladiella britannica]|nr:Oxysterol-binding protein-domain-containing protein [Blastocladiella britannica]
MMDTHMPPPSTAPSPTPPGVSDAIRSYRILEALRLNDITALQAIAASSTENENGARMTTIPELPHDLAVKFGSALHLAIAIAPLPVIEWLLAQAASTPGGVAAVANAQHPTTLETPLHVAARVARADVVARLLAVPGINDGARDHQHRRPGDVAASEHIRVTLAQHQEAFVTTATARIHAHAVAGDLDALRDMFADPRCAALVDINHRELASGNTVLHQAARAGNVEMAKWCLKERGADPFVRDRKNKFFYEITKSDEIKALFKKSTLAASPMTVAPDQMPSTQGILYKWTNYASGYKARWFTLDQGILSYFKHSDDVPNSCRGSIHLKIASLWVDSSDRHRFDIIGKGSIRYHLRAEHVAEAGRWIHAITQTKTQLNDMERIQRRNIAAATAGRAPSGSASTSALATPNTSMSGLLPEPLPENAAAHLLMLDSQSTLPGAGDDSSAHAGSIPTDAASMLTVKRRQSNASDGEDHHGHHPLDGSASGEEEWATTVPHAEHLPMTINSVRAQLEMQAHMVLSLATALGGNAGGNSIGNATDTAQALGMVTATVRSLVDDMVRMAEDRETYWRRQCAAEGARKSEFEQMLATLASENVTMEAEASAMASSLRKVQRQLAAHAAASAAATAAPSPILDAPTPRRGRSPSPSKRTPTNRRKSPESRSPGRPAVEESALVAPVLPVAGTLSPDTVPAAVASTPYALVPSLHSSDSDSEDDDDDDDAEFFDAVEDAELTAPAPSPPTVPAAPVDAATTASDCDKDKTGADNTDRAVETPNDSPVALPLIHNSLAGYETDTFSFTSSFRNTLPVDHAVIKSEVSLWSVLKNAIGKDLTRITLPVHFNEPLSMLQRLCEEVEYSVLLDLAWRRELSDERLLFVAAFAMSSYSSTVDRVAKPFNPLLGETFEMVRKDRGYRYISEQVSHHPPVSACYCESDHFTFFGEVNVRNRFWGKSMEISPLGVTHVTIKRGHLGEPDEHYSWRKVTTAVQNLIVGTLYLDHVGDLEVTNHATGEKCRLTFKPTGWRNRDRCVVEGKLFDKHGTETWTLVGAWDDKLVAKPVDKSRRVFSLATATSGAKNTSFAAASDLASAGATGSPPPPQQQQKNQVTLWRRYATTLTPSNFNLTPFALTLNQLPPSLVPALCPTDSRFRPDQRAMEEGRYDEAAFEKNRLEEKQREVRREREAIGHGHHQGDGPRWFVLDHDRDSGERFWRFTHEYWRRRETGQWEDVPDIY